MTCARCANEAIATCATCNDVACGTCAPFIPGPNRRKCPSGCVGYLTILRGRAIAAPAAPKNEPAPPAPPPIPEPPDYSDALLALGVSGPLYAAVTRYATAAASERALRGKT